MHLKHAQSFLRTGEGRHVSPKQPRRSQLSAQPYETAEDQLLGLNSLEQDLLRDFPEADGTQEEVEDNPNWRDDVSFVSSKIMGSSFSLLNLSLPVAFACWWMESDAEVRFFTSFVALLPLAAMLGEFTEELAFHTGELVGGLLNASLGNIVEMILTVQSLKFGLVDVVKAQLLGSILSNLLLVLGCSFLAGGIIHRHQTFNLQGAQCSTSLLVLGSFAIMLLSVAQQSGEVPPGYLMTINKIFSVLMLLLYCSFIFFQLIAAPENFTGDEQEEEQYTACSKACCLVMLSALTVIIACLSEIMVGSIQGLYVNTGVSSTFVGVILLPIIGNAAEHLTAVTCAMRNKPDLTMQVAVGSSTQIMSMMVPFSVLIASFFDRDFVFSLPPISLAILVMSIWLVQGIVNDGESHWFEGAMLLTAYFIVSIVYWFTV